MAFKLIWVIGYVIIKSFFRVRIEGAENLPERGAYLLVANHQSYIDPVAVHMVSQKQLNYLMAAEYYHDWRWKWFYDLFGCIPLFKGRPNRQAIERAIQILLDGQPLVLFPEAGISEDGKIRTWQPGIGLIALRTGVPVIPVLIRGTRHVLPMNRYMPRLKPVEVYAGKPIILKADREALSREDIRRAVKIIREAFLDLVKEKGLCEEMIGRDEKEMAS